MRNYNYDIENFIYDNENKTLSACEEDLYHDVRKYALIFPNKGKQFSIFNKKTNNFRRFKLYKETKLHYYFTTDLEDEVIIRCVIKKLTFTW